MRPAGLAVGRESESLDIEEMRLEDEKVRPPRTLHNLELSSGRLTIDRHIQICLVIVSYYL